MIKDLLNFGKTKDLKNPKRLSEELAKEKLIKRLDGKYTDICTIDERGLKMIIAYNGDKFVGEEFWA